MAVKLYLPEGGTTDLVCISRRQFFVRTPEDFLEFTRARRPDPETGEPDLAKLGAFLGAHPEAGPAVQEQLASQAAGVLRHDRLQLAARLPLHRPRRDRALGPLPLGARRGGCDARRRGGRGQGPRLPPAGDWPSASRPGPPASSCRSPSPRKATRSTTRRWPGPTSARRSSSAGSRSPSLAFDRDRDGDVLVFDPIRVTDGIETSDDPILHARSDAYAESVLRRSGARREA